MFKKITEFSSYMVSDCGEVYSSKTDKILVGNKNTPYHLVVLMKDGKQYMRKVHRLVAIEFLPNPNNYPFINHKDGNKRNNNVSNLEWCTAKQNSIHAFKIGLQKPLRGKDNPMYGKFGHLNPRSKMVEMLINDEVLNEFESIEIAVRYLKANGKEKANSSSISQCCNGIRYKTAYGYKWRFKL